jgi:hypothetical protein
MKKILFPFLICGSIVAVSTLAESCYYDKESDLYGTTPTNTTCDTTNAKFAAFVSPLISASCASSGCHSTSGQAGGINLGTYASIKSYITGNKARFLGSINRTAGYSQMPQGAAKLAACDITKIQTWINGGMLNN